MNNNPGTDTNILDYPDFNNPISNLLGSGGMGMLTDAAKNLLEGDLIALAWHNQTTRTEALTVRDVNSIEEAFRAHSLFGSSSDPVVGGACCCCTCTPGCCCTAVAVIKASK